MFKERIKLLEKIQKDKKAVKFVDVVASSIQEGMFCYMAGNGGSAAEADHFVSELLGRYKKDRNPLPAMSLNHPSTITCIGNDYNFEDIFSRQIKGLPSDNSCLIVFSTSGNSKNIIKAMQTAKEKFIPVVYFGGKGGGEALKYADIAYVVPSDETAYIQEIHQMLIHLICEKIDEKL